MGLFGAHVQWRADHLRKIGAERAFGQALVGRLGDTEIDDFWDWPNVVQFDQKISRLKVAVDDSFLMCMLNGFTNGYKQFQSLASCQFMCIAILCYWNTFNQFHHEIGSTGFRRTGIENFGDIRMVHHGKCLAFCFEARDDLLGIHTGFDNLQCHCTTKGLPLLCHIDRAHSPFANLLQQFVGPDLRAGFLDECLVHGSGSFDLENRRWRFQKPIGIARRA